jgi:hypothetical protein
MPKSEKWDRELVDAMVRLVAMVIEYADLSDAESDALMQIVLPRLRQTSGYDQATFQAMVLATCAELRREVGLPAAEIISLSRH